MDAGITNLIQFFESEGFSGPQLVEIRGMIEKFEQSPAGHLMSVVLKAMKQDAYESIREHHQSPVSTAIFNGRMDVLECLTRPGFGMLEAIDHELRELQACGAKTEKDGA
jgi:hypothetical protein